MSLARTPRLQQLLHYLGAKYLDGEADQITEYNIATEVFGRKKTDFIASEDAIARVETHRLRKRLTSFYESQGLDHSIQIRIPLGTYIPAFVERELPVVRVPEKPPVQEIEAAELPPPPSVEAAVEEPAVVPSIDPVLPRSRRFWRLGFALLLLVAACCGALLAHRAWVRRQHVPELATTPGQAPATVAAPVAGSPSPGVAVPFRMIAGYTGAPQRDDTGEFWGPDAYFHGGWAHAPTHAYIARTSNPFLFQYGHDGDFSYDIPLAPGHYELHLYFEQGSDTAQEEEAENKAIFDVAINGVTVLGGFDIVSDAMGRNVADERVFRDVSPAPDGQLHLALSTVLGTPSISALSILPGTEHRQNPIRLVMKPSAYTDPSGQTWSPDNYFLFGRYLSHNIPEGSANPNVLPFERFGHFEYAIPTDPRDRYTVILHFAELYFGSAQANLQETRLFRVLCNGQTLLHDFNIFQEAGTYHPLAKTFYHLKPSAQGKLNILFEPVSNYATVSAIEVLDENH